MSKPLLEFDPSQAAVAPKDAATVILLRDTDAGPEVFCVERNKKSRFLGGAIVFPGGKLDEGDREPAWSSLATAPAPSRDDFAPGDAAALAFAIAALRETLEEAALLLTTDVVTDAEVLALRAELERRPDALAEFLRAKRLRLDAGALVPFARWVTPEAETRRYDTRFFLAVAPSGQTGAHDSRETMASFWATPRAVLDRFDAREVQVAPPTHKTLEILASARSTSDALALARGAILRPICPKLFMHHEGEATLLALALPGDSNHDVTELRAPGHTRYVLRGEHWHAEG